MWESPVGASTWLYPPGANANLVVAYCISVFMLQRFRAWLDKHGPFDITVDGANLAFYGENYVGGSFKCWKVKVAYDTMMAQHPNNKILLVSSTQSCPMPSVGPQGATWLHEHMLLLNPESLQAVSAAPVRTVTCCKPKA